MFKDLHGYMKSKYAHFMVYACKQIRVWLKAPHEAISAGLAALSLGYLCRKPKQLMHLLTLLPPNFFYVPMPLTSINPFPSSPSTLFLHELNGR